MLLLLLFFAILIAVLLCTVIPQRRISVFSLGNRIARVGATRMRSWASPAYLSRALEMFDDLILWQHIGTKVDEEKE